MKSLKRTGKIIVLLGIIIGFFACDDDDNTAAFEIIGDVYTIKKLEDNDVIFAKAYFAFGNQPMSLAQVTTPEGEEIMLEPLPGNDNVYSKEPGMNDFTDEIPETGNYTFDVINEDIPHQAVDLLEFDFLDIPVIDTTYWNEATQTMSVEWDQLEDAESYLVKLSDLDGNIVYVGQLLASVNVKFEIDLSTGSWFSFAEPGTAYNVELHAFMYEAGSGNDDYMYNIQEISIGVKELIWGE